MRAIRNLLVLLTLFLPAAAHLEAELVGQTRSNAVEAIRQGDNARLHELLREPSLPDTRDGDGNTLLSTAAFLGNAKSVRILLDAGSDPNATNHAGATPLHRAATDAAKVRLLIEHGAEVNARSLLDNTPLILAARRHGAAPVLEQLIARGADVNDANRHGITALMAAAAADDIESVRLLLRHGANVNATPNLDVEGDPIWGGMRTPLMWASFRGSTNMARILLDHGADLHAQTPFGSALTQAAWSGSIDTARLLLARGARIGQTEPFSGFTALHWAASAENDEDSLVNLLLAAGADPDAEGGQPVDAFLGIGNSILSYLHINILLFVLFFILITPIIIILPFNK
jgi:ankyrin